VLFHKKKHTIKNSSLLGTKNNRNGKKISGSKWVIFFFLFMNVLPFRLHGPAHFDRVQGKIT